MKLKQSGLHEPTSEERAHERMRIKNAFNKPDYERVLILRMDRITKAQKMYNFYLALENENIHKLADIAYKRSRTLLKEESKYKHRS
mgnify:CR=1 FL=1